MKKKSKLQKLWGFEKKITIFAFFCSLIIFLNKQFSIFLADRSSFIRKNPKEHFKEKFVTIGLFQRLQSLPLGPKIWFSEKRV